MTSGAEASRFTRAQEGPQIERHRDAWLLGLVSLLPGFLLVLALPALALRADLGVVLLATHFVVQLVVLVVFTTTLASDASLGGVGRAVWGFAFLAAAPLALPLYWWIAIRSGGVPTSRFAVAEVALP